MWIMISAQGHARPLASTEAWESGCATCTLLPSAKRLCMVYNKHAKVVCACLSAWQCVTHPSMQPQVATVGTVVLFPTMLSYSCKLDSHVHIAALNSALVFYIEMLNTYTLPYPG